MQHPPGISDPAEHGLRLRATVRVARRRSFMVSAVVVGSLIILNLFLYAQSHNKIWLLLDAVFACTLGFRGWMAFGSGKKEKEEVEWELARLRQMTPPSAAPYPPIQWPNAGGYQPPVPSQAGGGAYPPAPQPPVPAPPPTMPPSRGWTTSAIAQQSVAQHPKQAPIPGPAERKSPEEKAQPDPWSGSWNF